jgi:hypothetical protein
MRTTFMLMALLSITATAAIADELALPVDPNANLETICEYGCSKRVRPPRSFTDAVKLKLLREAGLVWQDKRLYELDHIIPICAGGDPNDPRNMRLQEWESALRKDSAEVELCREICDGRIDLREAARTLSQ